MGRGLTTDSRAFLVVVDPGDLAYRDAVAEATIDLGEADRALFEELDAQGNPCGAVPAQRLEQVWVWLLAGETRPHTPRCYRVVTTPRESGGEPWHREEGVRFRVWHGDSDQDRALDIEIDGECFATYNYGWRHGSLYKPFFHPIYGPAGVPVTQNGEFPGTQRGHYWHHGLFIGHQHVNGISFWEEREGETGRILHRSFLRMDEGPVVGRFVERNLWRTPVGVDLLDERREVWIYRLPPNQRILDFRLSLKPVDEPVTLGKTAYNLLACHVPRGMHVADPLSAYDLRMYRPSEMRPGVRGGRVVTSEGEINVERCHATSGARARWVDHSGPVDGRWQGVAIFDHPLNPRYPVYWLNWNNMTHGPSFTFAEPYTIDRDRPLVLRYRVYIHDGDAATGRVEQRWQEFTCQPAVTVRRA